MRWRDYRQSDNVEDRRGMSVGRVAIGGGGLVVLLLVSLLTGIDPGVLLDGMSGTQVSVDQGGAPQQGGANDEARQFTSTVLASTEDVWNERFAAAGRRYEEPRLVLFSDSVQSACGLASAAVGPFYCPADHQLYLDVSFFDELGQRFGAPGDFAQAYVIAHEVGHHVQNLLNLTPRGAAPSHGADAASVRLELQADCLAGVWGYHANRTARLLEPGDVDEGLRAAAAIGDDRLQRSAGQAVQPESWTHGSSQMRARWLRRGLESGDPGVCDTFGTDEL